MKVALLGYGRMGKEIEMIAIDRNHSIELKIDINNSQDLTYENLKKADVAIDFSVPETAFGNIMKCFDANTPVVCGTTGWMSKFEEVKTYCLNYQKSFFYASNYSIGANIFFAINRKLAELMNKFPEYSVNLEEVHHIHKLDAPSGTAISIANDIISRLDRKTKFELNTESVPEALRIDSIREGEIPGIHSVTYDSAVDFINIKHSVKSRKGLALGAVMAAEFIVNKKGFFTMEDLMKAD